MPLSEHEQKILTDLEESLSKQDPRFAKNVCKTNVYARGQRRLREGAIGFAVGLLILVAFFTQLVLVGLVGLAVMLISSLVIARNAQFTSHASLSRQRRERE